MKANHKSPPAERVVKNIRKATRKQYSAEENIRKAKALSKALDIYRFAGPLDDIVSKIFNGKSIVIQKRSKTPISESRFYAES